MKNKSKIVVIISLSTAWSNELHNLYLLLVQQECFFSQLCPVLVCRNVKVISVHSHCLSCYPLCLCKYSGGSHTPVSILSKFMS